MSQHARITRRIVGLLSARLPDLELQQVSDSRDPRWVSWPLVTVLRTLITCLAASCTSLRQAEELTEQMSPAIRRKLRIRGRIPDTTMRTIAAGLEPDDVRQRMHQQIRAAARRKALAPNGLPFNVAMLDGKSTALPSCDDHFAQRQSNDSRLIGLLRTMSCSLVTTAAQPCIDAIPIPASTNEMGHFRRCVDLLLDPSGPQGCPRHRASPTRRLQPARSIPLGHPAFRARALHPLETNHAMGRTGTVDRNARRCRRAASSIRTRQRDIVASALTIAAAAHLHFTLATDPPRAGCTYQAGR